MGADQVAAQLSREAAARRVEVEIFRNGSWGIAEALYREVAPCQGRVITPGADRLYPQGNIALFLFTVAILPFFSSSTFCSSSADLFSFAYSQLGYR